jgi:micrococcal nuclease
MRTTLLATLLLLAVSACAHEPVAAGKAPRSSKRAEAAIVLNGERVEVGWSDGDSFGIRSGKYAGASTRLAGYNALESYGPVHRWGDWTAAELYEIAASSKELAAAEDWVCTTDGKLDSYERLLIDCPGVSKAIISAGHGFVMAIDEVADPALLAAQREARAAKVGMWAKGTPKEIVTSVHPAKGDKPGYNRVVDLDDGSSRKWQHQNVYAECEEVCLPDGGSCLVFVEFDRRYNPKTKAACLR